jgi:hypothetical protein
MTIKFRDMITVSNLMLMNSPLSRNFAQLQTVLRCWQTNSIFSREKRQENDQLTYRNCTGELKIALDDY